MSDEVLEIDGYKLTNCIAAGNATEIWEIADQSSGGQPLCMKLLLPEALKKPEAKQVLKHEAKVARALDHPSIIKIHKVAVTKKHGYIVMDYFRAPNIKTQIMNDMVGLHSRFRKVFESLCLALGYMHEKGWVHRDIKPENILSNKVGEMRLIDFSLAVRAAGGLGKLLGARTKAVQGTRTYIAPETLLKKAPTIQTDMYSLGITVYEILTGNPPFRGMSPGDLLRMHVQEKAPEPSSYNPNITPEMDRLVARLLEKKPDKRPKTMEEIYSEFRALKVFKEDPKDIHARRTAARKEADMSALGASDRINSRRDHQRSEAGLNPLPAPPAPKPNPKPAPQTAPPRQAQPQHPPAGQPVAGQGYGPPGMPPNAPYPNYPPPYGFPPGMQPPPGYLMPQLPPGYSPGAPMPQGYPPQMQPQPPQPQGSPPAPIAPPQQNPAAKQPQPAPPAAAPPQPPKPESKPAQKPEEEDLPLMGIDELPDVL